MYNPTVSVIINTYNRAHHLKRLLDCLTKQTYNNFEVVVVNGPSTDDTDQVLEQYKDAIRIDTCPEVNLCISRNIGIRTAAGEILAFIDDDAIPQDMHWIENAVKPFNDEKIGIVGGAVYRINGTIEFEYGYFSIWGDNIATCPNPKPEEELDRDWYRGIAGGNAFIRRTAIVQVGGFDEYYAYYMDETDLCLRIIQAGYRTEYGMNMAIIHEAAKSPNRKSLYHLNWDVISKSRGYFTMKASEQSGFSVNERSKKAKDSCEQWFRDFKWMLSEKKINKDDYKSFVSMVNDGIKTGIRDGLNAERKLDRNILDKSYAFLRYNKNIAGEHLNLCFFCEQDIIDPLGGVPTHINALAYGLIADGHNVYVITRGEEELLSNVAGVNICTIVPENLPIRELDGLPISQGRLNFSYACFVKLQQLKKNFYVDVVESMLWDFYGLVSAYMEHDIPLAIRLQTPLKMVMETFQMKDSVDLATMIEFETVLMQKSDYIISISDCIKDTIEDLYEMRFQQMVTKNYIGIDPVVKTKPKRGDDGKLIVFFIGRLERRKGVDSVIATIPLLLEKHPHVEFHLAGDCEIVDELIGTTYKKKLLTENKGAKWLNRVKFMGKITNEAKEQEFADCDIFISPSLYESFGIIFIEAMRYGKPVIGCTVGGMKEVIEDGVTGLLCQPGDAKSFETCIDKLIVDKNLREDMGKAGLERLNRMFTTQTMCKGTVEIYRKMINQHNRKR